MTNTDIKTSVQERRNFETANSRLQGVYPQANGLFMQRVKIFGGRINLQQWRTVARLAAIYTPQTPLHLTTRQDIEFHNVSADDLVAVQRVVNAIGLSTLSAGGDSVRNITVCTGCVEGTDIYDFAKSVKERLEAEPMTFNLPRKFKISFSGCTKACAKPFINDLGFVLQKNGLFTVVGAGSLGPKPALGIELYKELPPSDILPLCKAAIEFFAEYGDRQNRRRARLRHVRERLGDDSFKLVLDRRFKAMRLKNKNQNVSIIKTDQNSKLLAKLQLPNGDISPEAALLLADYAESLACELRINLSHGLELYARACHTPDLLKAMPPELAAFTKLPEIIACPGCKSCPNALTDCCQTAESIRQEVEKNAGVEACVHISGCPNDCAQSAIANIGLIGIIRTVDGIRKQCYRVLTGGTNGRTSLLAQETAVLPADSVPQYVRTIIIT